ncbi:ABC transporter ATP-binding protein [Prosthecobacter sp.]|jgi:ABC-type oligopeptide transport system ATPase subunit|uniref:ABC transporter ATP-binding protein n=1 Tax=Prosthecobacter sp. TaxID=1965333 RepID=UPI003784D4C4
MPLLSVQDLKIHFPVRGGWLGRATDVIKAVDKVSFEVEEGSTVGLVGESGSGKSTVARALLKLIPATEGTVTYAGRDILAMSEKEFRPLRKEMQMVFQDPIGSLNPRMTVESILAEPQEIHFKEKTREERRDVSVALLKKVGLPEDALQRYPHEFSGGQRQRIGIARALAVRPKFLICDEPVSALDVSVQAQILNLLKDIQQEFNLTLLFIAHDLAVVRHMSDRIVVMHHGKIVEQGPADQVCEHPRHDYTQRLLDAVPVLM